MPGIIKEELPNNNSKIPNNKAPTPIVTKIDSRPFFPNLYTKNANRPSGITIANLLTFVLLEANEITIITTDSNTITPNIFRSNFPLGNKAINKT